MVPEVSHIARAQRSKRVTTFRINMQAMQRARAWHERAIAIHTFSQRTEIFGAQLH